MEFFGNIIKGIMIGIANIIPGVSGGTMAVSLGIYDRLIGSISGRVSTPMMAPYGASKHAIEAIDWNTIGLLVGMMVLVRLTETTGVYTWLAIRAAQAGLVTDMDRIADVLYGRSPA